MSKNVLEKYVRSLLTEEVFGKQAFVYHGSKTQPETLGPNLINDLFAPGLGAGGLYGHGLYTIYEPDRSSNTFTEIYGEYLYKLKVNLYGCIIFDADPCKKVYGKLLTPYEQLKFLGHDKLLSRVSDNKEYLQVLKRPIGEKQKTSNDALFLSKFVNAHVKGLVFTGETDGQVCVIFDPSSVVPVSWALIEKNNPGPFQSFDKKSLKPSVQRSSMQSFTHSRHNLPEEINNPQQTLRNIMRRPSQKRIFDGGIEAKDFIDIDGNIIFPKNMTITGDIHAEGSNLLPYLANGLIVKGNVHCAHSSVKQTGERTRIEGNLDLSNSEIEHLSPGLHVLKSFYLNSTSIKELPKGLYVGEGLYLENCYNLTEFPDDIRLKGDLYLKKCGVKSLPLGMDTVNGTLFLSYSKVEELPENLHVKGELYLNSCPVKRLPDGLKIDRNLSLENSCITSFGKGIKVGGILKVGKPHWSTGIEEFVLPDDIQAGQIID